MLHDNDMKSGAKIYLNKKKNKIVNTNNNVKQKSHICDLV